jgi:predicted transcriptional regulator
MDAEPYGLIAELFHDSRNIEVLCSIYENEVTPNEIATMLEMPESEVTQRLEMLHKNSLVNRTKRKSLVLYSLVNPRVCDSILSLRDAIRHT